MVDFSLLKERVWFYCEHLLVACFNLSFLLFYFIVLCFYNNKSRLSLSSSCRANLYANVGTVP